MKKIAIYGKGGIGKSTISSNLTACMASMGYRMMQIGCDPKHDSTQMLCGCTETLLDTLRLKGSSVRLEDVVHKGCLGTYCIEIGGPQPGVGCAGRGIIRGIELIKQLRAFETYGIDVCIYDVLGDVVCGGFFEPIRRGGTDEVYIVTSGEFNALFAANNICCGFINFVPASDKVQIGGIIGNLRGLPNEETVLRTFAEHIGVPLVGIVPRDVRIERTTNHSLPLACSDPDGALTQNFQTIAGKILEGRPDRRQLNPYTFDELKTMQRTLTGSVGG